jgi:APA family basic amino acid/polyamine antiporter
MRITTDLKIIEAAETGGSPTEFRKALGLFDSIMIVAGIMVGSWGLLIQAVMSRFPLPSTAICEGPIKPLAIML